uniref:Ataxin-10 n=1 Tax=Parastrongyloides trichosuri TaxID=131310 RepID=A0A0N5A561_PARTI
MDNEIFTKIFSNSDISSITDDKIKNTNRWICNVDEKEIESIISKNVEGLKLFVNSLFESILLKYGNDLKDDSEFLRQKLLFRIFVNASTKSNYLRKICLLSLKLEHWYALLRFEELIQETSYAICCYGLHLYTTYLLDEKMPSFIEDLTILNNTNEKEHVNGSLTAFFWKLFEESGGFLSESFQSLDREVFTYLLNLLNTIIEENIDDKIININENNVYFLISLLERCCFNDFEELKDLNILSILLSILGSLALDKNQYEKQLFSDTRIVNNCSIILKNIIYFDVSKETKKGFGKFNSLCTKEDEKFMSNLKKSCLRLLTNMCSNNIRNKKSAGKNNAIQSVLYCSFEKPSTEFPLKKEWAVMCLKALTDDCPENQKILIEFKDKINNKTVESLERKILLGDEFE